LRPSPAYRLALAAVAFAMVLLPLLYVGLITGLAWGLWAYCSLALGPLLQELRGSFASLLCFLPLFAGIVVLICLVKPLFARPVRGSKPVKLDPREEPLLFEFVACLCKALHAPVPKEIHVDCRVNASASFRRGLLSIFGDDLVLTLGLPVVAGLSAQQLAGIMAHELGHFSQRFGLRVSVVIRIINFWFARLVFQRDRFDAALAGAAQRAPVRLRWIFHFNLFVVYLTRRVLWALMMLGHVLSSFMMRQMEYDADRYEVRLAGFRSFDSSMREMFALSAAFQMAMKNLTNQWKENRLVDKFPRLVVANRQEGVKQLAAQLEHFMANEEEERFGTHPTACQRVTRALREKGLGVFSSDLPASALFSRFDELERTVSLAFYREMVGNQVKPQDLIAVAEIKEREAQTESDRAALERFFQNPNPLRALPLLPRLPTINAEPPAVVAELEKSRKAVLEKDSSHTREIERYREAVDERLNALRALAVIQAGFRIPPGGFGQDDGSPVAVERAAGDAAERMRAVGVSLEQYENVEVRRLFLALILLDAPQTGGRVPEPAARREEISRYLACAASLKDAFPRLFELRETRLELDILVQQIKPKTENPRLFAVIGERLGKLQGRLKELHRILRPQTYPFDHARTETTLAQFAIPTMPAGDDFQGLMAASELALARLHEVYDRLLGRLASIAERVEMALGLPPLTHAAAGADSLAATAPPFPQAGSPAPAELAAAHGPAASTAIPVAPSLSPPAAAGPISESKAEAVANREAYLLFFRSPLVLRPLPLPGRLPDALADPRLIVGELREDRLAAAKAQEEHGRMVRIYQAAERKLVNAWRAESLLAAGLSIDPAAFEVPGGDLASVTRAQGRTLLEMKLCETGIQPFDDHQARRLIHALTLLGEERIAFRVTEADRRRRETPILLACATALHSRFPALRELRKVQCILETLGSQNARHPNNPGLREAIDQHMAAAYKLLQELQRDLHRDPSPFASVRGTAASLAQVAIPSLPADRNYDGIYTMAGRALKELSDLQHRVLGRLISTADAVEQALGFAP
jgi:Zn-dependent protease with chaperone function